MHDMSTPPQPPTAGRGYENHSKQNIFMSYMKKQVLEMSLLGVGTVHRLEKGAWPMVKWQASSQ